MNNIQVLKNKYAKTRDVWIVAAGPSSGFIDPGFFEDKITIAVNRVWKRLDPFVTYAVIKEGQFANEADRAGIRVITSKYHCGSSLHIENRLGPNSFYFDHLENELERIDLSVIGTDRIAVSYSTITSAIHLGAYIGAKNIILVGHDCGILDGEINYPGYGDAVLGGEFYREFITRIEPQTLALRERIREVYGVRIYSLNPFINFGLEGHIYERS